MFKRLVIRYLPFSLVLLLAISLPISQVLADCTWAKTFDFTSSEQGWTSIVSYPYTANWLDQTLDGDGQNRISYSYTFAAPTKVTTFTAKIITYDSPVSVAGTVTTSTSFGLTPQDDPVDTHLPYDDSIMYAVTTSGSASSDITFDIHGGSWGFSIFQIVLDGEGANEWGLGDGCSEGGGGGTLTRPLNASDEATDIALYDTTKIANMAQAFPHEFNVYDILHTGGPETVQAWSENSGAWVHAATDATVEFVEPLGWQDCGIGQYYAHVEGAEVTGADFYDFPAATIQPCLVELYDTSVIGNIEDVPWPDYSDESSVYKARYYLDPTNVYIVTLRVAGLGRLVYLVKDAKNYVIPGDTIQAGCVLGTTIPLTPEPVQGTNFAKTAAAAGAVSIFSGGTLSFAAGAVAALAGIADAFIPPSSPVTTNHGITTISLYSDEDDSLLALLDQLTVEPTNQDRCAGSGQYKDCLADNPTFLSQGSGWVASGNVEWLEPGVILDPLEQISSSLNLDPEANYTVTVFGEGVDGQPSQIRVWLGSNTDRLTVPVEWTSLQLTTSPVGDPDQGSFYTVGIQNTGSNPIEVRSICVTDGAPNLGPNSCYFNNNSFVQGLSGWDVTEGVEVADQALNVPDDGVISQNVMLNPLPGGPATYKLVVRGDWWYTGELDTVSSASAIAQVQYEWPDGSGYQNMVPVTIKGNLAYGAGQLAYVANIEVSSTTDDVMNIKVSTTTAGDMGVVGIRITDACLSTIDGGNFPGQGGGSAPPPLNANCEYVSRPQNNDPASWLQWHWAMSNQFFRCDLLVLLNKMYKLGQQSYTLAGWEARYMQSTMRMYSSWFGKQLFPWFNGQFSNLVVGVRNIDTSVTTSADTGGGVLGFVRTVGKAVQDLVALIQLVINQFVNLFQFATDLMAAFIGAFNDAQAIPIPNLPQCVLGPDESVICAGIWVVDNTILAGPGQALIPIILSFGSAHLLLWLVSEFKRNLLNQGQSL